MIMTQKIVAHRQLCAFPDQTEGKTVVMFSTSFCRCKTAKWGKKHNLLFFPFQIPSDQALLCTVPVAAFLFWVIPSSSLGKRRGVLAGKSSVSICGCFFSSTASGGTLSSDFTSAICTWVLSKSRFCSSSRTDAFVAGANFCLQEPAFCL